MKLTKAILATATLAMCAITPLGSFAQSSMDQGKIQMTNAPSMSDGEIRKIDKDAGKLTIRHGPIKHMDMPPMNMVFMAKDKALLDKVKVGDKIRFMVVEEGGKMVVTDIQPAK